MTNEFVVGEHVRSPRGTAIDPADKNGVVESFHDWWIMVRMDDSHILTPFMVGEIEHV